MTLDLICEKADSRRRNSESFGDSSLILLLDQDSVGDLNDFCISDLGLALHSLALGLGDLFYEGPMVDGVLALLHHIVPPVKFLGNFADGHHFFANVQPTVGVD